MVFDVEELHTLSNAGTRLCVIVLCWTRRFGRSILCTYHVRAIHHLRCQSDQVDDC